MWDPVNVSNGDEDGVCVREEIDLGGEDVVKLDRIPSDEGVSIVVAIGPEAETVKEREGRGHVAGREDWDRWAFGRDVSTGHFTELLFDDGSSAILPHATSSIISSKEARTSVNWTSRRGSSVGRAMV